MRGHLAFVILLALVYETVSEEGQHGGNEEGCHDEHGGIVCNEEEETTLEGDLTQEKYKNETIGCEVC